jgi:hypothetical protein
MPTAWRGIAEPSMFVFTRPSGPGPYLDASPASAGAGMSGALTAIPAHDDPGMRREASNGLGRIYRHRRSGDDGRRAPFGGRWPQDPDGAAAAPTNSDRCSAQTAYLQHTEALGLHPLEQNEEGGVPNGDYRAVD